MKIMNDVQWTGEYSMEDFVVEFSKWTPVLMKTLTGTLGYDEIHIISGDEIYWIRGLKKQKRIVATLKECDKFVSIPLNYPVQFELYINQDFNTSKKIPPGRPLTEIFEEIDFASGKRYFIRAAQNEKLFFQVGSDAGNKARFGLMEVKDSYDEKYLVGHPICNNQIHSNTFAIPVYINIELTVATSFVNRLQERFDKWFQLIESIVDEFQEGDIKMCEEIIIFNKCPQNCAYEYIDPKTFTMNEKSKALLKDYSKESNPYIFDKSASIKKNSCSPKSQLTRSVNLPAIPRRTPPTPSEGEKSSYRVPKTGTPSSNPTLTLVKGEYEPIKLDKSSNARYEEILNKNKLSSEEQNNCSLRAKCRNSAHLKPDSGDVIRKSSPQINSPISGSSTGTSPGCLPETFSIYEVSPNADVGRFSIRDVQRCLRLLNLERHCETFEEMQVDGELLLGMDEDLLISECSFSKFEAMKLIKFSKGGWRPNP